MLDVDGSFYFMEMNTRLQVEHPVTEYITGQDLVEWQLRVASGEELPLAQDELSINGHSFEARIYAEDPDNDFLPETGQLTYLQPPEESEHVRVDTGVLQGDEVSVYYDPMIAKLIVWDENRERALARLARSLSEYRVSGVTTNMSFLYNLATCQPFVEADLDTGFIEKHQEAIFHDSVQDVEANTRLASLYLLLRREQIIKELASKSDPSSPWNMVNGWRLNEPHSHTGTIIVNGTPYDVPVEEIGSGELRRFCINVNGTSVLATGRLDGNELYADIDGYRQTVYIAPNDGSYTMFTQAGAMQFELAQPDYGDEDAGDAVGGFCAPMNGTVVEVPVEAGANVKQGDILVIMEAMKMEHAIRASSDGVVTEIYFAAGDLVDGGAALLDFEAAE